MAVSSFLRVAPMLVVAVGCTSPASQHASGSAGPAKPAVSVSRSQDALSICQAQVPGAQHALRVTVGTVRGSAIGIQAPRPEVAHFAAGIPEGSPAYFCYRYLSATREDEWWATTGNRAATIHVAGIGGATHDLGTFDGSGFD